MTKHKTTDMRRKAFSCVLAALLALPMLGCRVGSGSGDGPDPVATRDDVAITSFEYTRGGSSADSFASYSVWLEDGVVRMTADFITRDGADVELCEDALAQLASVVEKHDLCAWNGFDETNAFVLDGSNFSLSFVLEDGTSIHAHGSNSFPNGFSDAEADILACLESLLPEEVIVEAGGCVDPRAA